MAVATKPEKDRLHLKIDPEVGRMLRYASVDQKRDLSEIVEIALRKHLEETRHFANAS